MNVIKHRVYKLELDIWEALQPEAEKEIDKLVLFVKQALSHNGNVKLTLVSEERNK